MPASYGHVQVGAASPPVSSAYLVVRDPSSRELVVVLVAWRHPFPSVFRPAFLPFGVYMPSHHCRTVPFAGRYALAMSVFARSDSF